MPFSDYCRKKNEKVSLGLLKVELDLCLETKGAIPVFEEIFCGNNLEAVGMKCGLIIRKWRVTGVKELTLATIAAVLNGSGLTGPSIQAHLFGMFGKYISKVSILEHFKKREFGIFLRELLKGMSNILPPPELKGWLAPFSEVNIYDSSSWRLPEDEDLIKVYPAQGGDGGLAGVKVGTSFNWINYTFPEAIVMPLKKSDTMKMFNLEIKQNSLQLFDLGFFSVDAAKRIVEKSAYFISRYHYGMVLKKGEKRLSVSDIIADYGRPLDMDVTVTNNNFPVRFISEKLPKNAYESRLAHLERQAQRQGRKLKEEQIILAHQNIFLTNISRNLLPSEAMPMLYSVRWQIELVYKVCKSLLKLGRNYWRNEVLIENSIYAVFLTYQTIMTWAEKFRRSCSYTIPELSPWLLIKHFSWLFLIWIYYQMNPYVAFPKFLNEMVLRCMEFCIKDNRKGRPTTLRKIEQEISYDMLCKIKGD